jgi:hypothetical protein
VAARCPALQELHVANSVVDIEALISYLPQLDSLIVVDCSHEEAETPADWHTRGDSLNGGSLHGGGSLHSGGSLHGGSLHSGGSLHGGSLHGGGSLRRGSFYGGSLHGGSLHVGSLPGDSLHGDSLHDESCRLRRLVLHDYDGLWDTLLVRIAGRCPLLEELNLSEIDGLEYDVIVCQVADLCPRLQTLRLTDCLGLKEIREEKVGLHNLRHLDVSGCRNATWDAILKMATGSKLLSHVTACRLPCITADNLAELLSRYSNTFYLIVTDFRLIRAVSTVIPSIVDAILFFLYPDPTSKKFRIKFRIHSLQCQHF